MYIKITQISSFGFLLLAISAILGLTQASGMSYMWFQDPYENAFGAEVPSGWIVDGGVARNSDLDYSLLDYRPYIHLVSPDGKIYICDGDKRYTRMFVTPFTLGASSYHERSLFSSNHVSAFVMHYMSGEEFAKWYVTNFLAEGCSDLTFLYSNNVQNSGQSLIPELAGITNIAQSIASHNTAEILFSCIKNGEPMNGYYLSMTSA